MKTPAGTICHNPGPSKLALAFLALLFTGGLTAEARSQEVLATITADLGAKRHKSVTEGNGTFFTSPSYTQVTATTVTIPSSIPTARLLARFSSESRCNGPSGSWCTLRILVNGFEMNPVVGTDYAWDSPGEVGATASIDRTSGILLPGTHTVSVEARPVGQATLLALDDWQLTLELWRAEPPLTSAREPERADVPEPLVVGSSSSNKGAKRLYMVTDTAPISTISSSYTALAATTITIPSAFNTARIAVRFSGESSCAVGNACALRMLVDGVEMDPVSGDFAFDVPGGPAIESQSIERTSGPLPPGIHIVAVQGAAIGGGTFAIDDWSLVITVWRVS
jgi:hypothetical protein